MSAPTLVIADPPHGDVDAATAAGVLDLVPVELRMKANYRLPEIWVAEADPTAAEAAATRLRECGLRVTVARASELVDVPRQRIVRSFAFTDEGLVAELPSLRVRIAPEDDLLIVPCTPRLPEDLPVGAAATELPGEGELPEDAAFVDLYASRGGKRIRLAVFRDFVDFSGFEPEGPPSHAARMRRFEEVLAERFPDAAWDRRLVNMRLRRRAVPGVTTTDAAEDLRKGYSFASRGLTELLAGISSELAGVGQADFSSRLCYLTRSE